MRIVSEQLPRSLISILRGRWELIEPLLDLTTLPLGFLVSLLAVLAVMPVRGIRIYALTGLAVVLLHIARVTASFGNFAGVFQALISVPGYLVWKFTALPAIRRAARRDSTWIRAHRASANEE